jgi:hypothetical protein
MRRRRALARLGQQASVLDRARVSQNHECSDKHTHPYPEEAIAFIHRLLDGSFRLFSWFSLLSASNAQLFASSFMRQDEAPSRRPSATSSRCHTKAAHRLEASSSSLINGTDGRVFRHRAEPLVSSVSQGASISGLMQVSSCRRSNRHRTHGYPPL